MAFGTLKADTLTHSTAGSLATNFVVNGSAKSNIVYDQTAPSITGSLNISSLTDTSAGRAFPNFTNNKSAVDYSAVNSAGMAGSGFSGRNGQTNPYNTGKYEFHTFNSSATVADYSANSAATFGDLA